MNGTAMRSFQKFARTRTAAIAACVGALALFGTAPANAVTIGFDGVVITPPATGLFPGAPHSEGGFTLTSNDPNGDGSTDAIFAPNPTDLVNDNGTNVFGWVTDAGVVITLTQDNGQPFSFESFDTTNSLPLTGNPPPIFGLDVIGHLSGGGTVTQSVTFTPDTFTTVSLNPGFTNLLSVEFIEFANSFADPVIDNLAVTPAAVAEPGALAMFAVGLAGLGVVRRRRKRADQASASSARIAS